MLERAFDCAVKCKEEDEDEEEGEVNVKLKASLREAENGDLGMYHVIHSTKGERERDLKTGEETFLQSGSYEENKSYKMWKKHCNDR